MVVDDNEKVRKMIMSFIDDIADGFVECSVGAEALLAYANEPPDIVLMDVKMTDMDGFETTRRMIADFPDATIFIVSQWESPALREEARLSGAVGYINKADLRPLRTLLKGRC